MMYYQQDTLAVRTSRPTYIYILYSFTRHNGGIDATGIPNTIYKRLTVDVGFNFMTRSKKIILN